MSAGQHTTQLAPWLERAWLHRYLDRELTDTETEWFEMYVLDKPHLIAELEADNDLRDWVPAHSGDAENALRAGTTAPTMRLPSSRDEIPAARRASKRWRPRGRFVAVAAGWTVALFAGAGAERLLRPSVHEDQIIASPARIVFDTMRGEDEPSISRQDNDESSHILLEVAVPPDARDVVAVFGNDHRVPLKVSTDGFASFLVARAQLPEAAPLRVEYESLGERRSVNIELHK